MARDVFRPRTLRRRTRALLDKLSQLMLVVMMGWRWRGHSLGVRGQTLVTPFCRWMLGQSGGGSSLVQGEVN